MSDSGVLLNHDVTATRLGRALARASEALAAAVSFKTGCAAIAPMFGDMLDVDRLVMTVDAASPTFTLHADWHAGQPVRIIDSREIGFDAARPDLLAENPFWEIDYPNRLHISLRLAPGQVGSTAGLDALSALLLPFFELSRRSDRLVRATSLLDVAMDAIATEETDSARHRIVERIGHSVGAAAAFYAAVDGALVRPARPAAICAAGHSSELIEQMFTLLGNLPDGPVQRAFDSPLMAAPVTRASLAEAPESTRASAMVEQMPVSDFIALHVVHQDRPIGVLLVIATAFDGDAPSRRFTQDEIATVASHSMIAGWALPLADCYALVRRSLQESEMLRHVAVASFRSRDFSEVLSLASGVAKAVFGADYVAVAVIEPDWSASRWVHAIGNRTQAHERRSMHHFTGDTREWFQRPSSFVIRNIATDEVLDDEARLIHTEEGLISSVSVPFPLPNGGYGFLVLGFREERAIEEADIRFVRSMAQTIAAAL